jgi:hypothetical protein
MGQLTRVLAIILAAAVGGCSSCSAAPPPSPSESVRLPGPRPSALADTTTKPEVRAMNKNFQPYDLLRKGASVYLARIAKVRFEPAGGGQRRTQLDLTIEESLFGPRGAGARHAAFMEPESEFARLKFPTPLWGRIELTAGTLVLLATTELGEELTQPLYVDTVKGADDPPLVQLRDVLGAESASHDPVARRARYLGWLSSSEPLHALFGAEALARDHDLPDVDPRGDVAAALGRAANAATDDDVRMNLVEWMWSGLARRTNEAGRVALINATLRCAADPDEDVRQICLDKLSEVDVTDLEAPGVAKAPATVPFLEARIAEETAPEPRAHLNKILNLARP